MKKRWLVIPSLSLSALLATTGVAVAQDSGPPPGTNGKGSLAALDAARAEIDGVRAHPAESDEPPPATTTGPSPGDDPLAGQLAIDGRTFVDDNGRWTWLGDTAWSLFVNLDREEVDTYLDTRQAQGFNVVHSVAVFPQAGGPGPNPYGHSPYSGDLSNPNAAYFDHVDYVVDAAAQRNMVVALWPVWADGQIGSVLTQSNAYSYGQFLGNRYAEDDNIVWVMGGDLGADGDQAIWADLARGLEDAGADQLKSYHPRGQQSSLQWFDGSDWLDFHMHHGSHCLRYDQRDAAINTAYSTGLPFLDSEPLYEDHPYCWDQAPSGFSTPLDVRRDAYWSMLGGAAGHTYGHHSVWPFVEGSHPFDSWGGGDPPGDQHWDNQINDPGAKQMGYVRSLIESRPRVDPADDLLADPQSGATRNAAATDNASTILAYTASGRDITVNLDPLDGDTAQPWWYNPRTGESTRLSTVPSAGPTTFSPPTSEDWVLVVDQQAANYEAPGSGVIVQPPGDGDDDPEPPDTDPQPGDNLAANPVLKTGATGWCCNGARVSVSDHQGAAHAYEVTDAVIYPPRHEPVTPGSKWRVAVDVQGSGTATVGIDWYEGSTWLSSSQGNPATISASGWATTEVVATAPPEATRFQVRVDRTGSGVWRATQAHYSHPTDDQPPTDGEGTTAAETQGWGTPIRSDDFSGSTLDGSKWNIYGEGGSVGGEECWEGHAGNGRRCVVNVTVADGLLTLTGEAGGDSAGMASTLDQQYGRWEARVRSFNTGSSGHPYHPLLIIWPESNKWPAHGEYDFLENGAPGEQCAEAFLHYPGHTPIRQEHAVESNCGAPLSEWHNIALEWGADNLIGYIDGEEWFRFGEHDMTAMPSGHLTIQLDNFYGDGMRPAKYQVDWVKTYSLN